MSILSLTAGRDLGTGGQASFGKALSFTENVAESYNSGTLNFNSNSSVSAKRKVMNDRDAEFLDLTGQEVSTVFAGDRRAMRSTARRQQLIDERILELRAEDAETYSSLKTFSEIEDQARKDALESQRNYDRRFEYTPGYSKYLAAFAGGTGAQFVDPLQASMLVMGGGASMAIGGGLLKSALVEAGIGAATELSIQPAVMDWQKEIGAQYGISQAAANVLVSGLSAGALTIPPALIGKFIKSKRTSELFQSVADNEALDMNLRAAAESLSRVADFKETAPSPDMPRHGRNQASSLKARIKNELIKGDEIDARIIDNIDGLPSEAFDFMSPESKHQVPLKSGGAYKELPVSKMTKQQLSDVVEESLLPKIRRQLLDDYAMEAKRLGNVQEAKLHAEYKKLKSEIKNNPDPVKQSRLRDISKTITRVEQQKDVKNAIDKMVKNEVPDGDGYTASMVRKTLDKVTNAAYENNKMLKSMTPKRVAKVSDNLRDTGAIKTEIKNPAQALDELKALEKQLDEAYAFEKAAFDEIPDDAKLIDDNGEIITKARFEAKFKPDEAELDAVSLCSTGGGE